MRALGRHDRSLNGLLADLAARLAGSGEDQIAVGPDDLGPADKICFSLLSKAGLLIPCEPAREMVCDGCERACPMPVQVIAGRAASHSRAFIVCDKRDDIGRVPIDPERLRRWSLSFDRLAEITATFLGTDRPPRPMATRLARSLGLIRHGKENIEVILCSDASRSRPGKGLAVVLQDASADSEEQTIGLSRLIGFKGHKLHLDRTALQRVLGAWSDDSVTACEIRYERGEILLCNHMTGQTRTIATPNFNSSNDNAFQALYDNAGKTFSLKELREAAREPNLANLHKIVENLNFDGPLKTLFFRVSKRAIRFDRTVTIGQLATLAIDPKHIF